MSVFVGRQREIAHLNEVLSEGGARMLMLYGRRQIGKTTLALRWAEQTGLPIIYWVASKDVPAQLIISFSEALTEFFFPDLGYPPSYPTWKAAFEAAAKLIKDQPTILIMDQFSQALESDARLVRQLQLAWEEYFKSSNTFILLVGSQTQEMLKLTAYDQPLYGRIDAEASLYVEPLAFPFIVDFLPDYTPADRVKVTASTGGVPAYLERFHPRRDVGENIWQLFMRRRSSFRNEPRALLSLLLPRETRNYEAIMKIIAVGNHLPREIARQLDQTTAWTSPYLRRLEEVGLISRVFPATTPAEKRLPGPLTRYYIADQYLDFHFRFIVPNLRMVERDMGRALWQRIEGDFETWAGETAFRRLCRNWVSVQTQAGEIFLPDEIGAHWGEEPGGEVDLVAINWEEQQVLFASCDWGTELVAPYAVESLIQAGEAALPGRGWTTSYVIFARVDFAEPTRGVAEEKSVRLVDLAQIDADLRVAYAPLPEEARDIEEGAGGEEEGRRGKLT